MQSNTILPNDPAIVALSLRCAAQRDARKDLARQVARSPQTYGSVRVDSTNGDETAAYLRLLAIDYATAADPTRVDAFAPMAFDALTSVYREIYQVAHRPLDAAIMFPVRDGGHSAAAESVAYFEADIIGSPKVSNSYVNDIPLVPPPVMSEFRMPVIPYMIAAEQNFMDPRRLGLARENNAPAIDTWIAKTRAAVEAINAAQNAVWLYGSTISGIDGIFGNPYVPQMDPSPAPWSTLNADQLKAELSKLFNFIPDRMFSGPEARSRVRVFLPHAALRRIRDVMITGTATSVWQSFRDAYGLRDDQIAEVYSLSANNSTLLPGAAAGLTANTALVTITMGDDWDPYLLQTQPIEIPVPPAITGINERTVWHSRAGGLIVTDARRLATCSGL